MVPLAMTMLDELRDCLPEVPLTEWNDAIETFFLDRPDESHGIGVRVGRALGDQHSIRGGSLTRGAAQHSALTPNAVLLSICRWTLNDFRRRILQ